MTRTTSELDRLAATHFRFAPDTRALVGDNEREVLLARITADQARDPSRRAPRRGLVAVAVIGACAIAAAVVVAGPIEHRGSSTPGGATHPRIWTTAYVVRATMAALANTSHDLVRIQMALSNGETSTFWFDFANGDSRTDVVRAGELNGLSTIVGHVETVVYYPKKEWWTTPPGISALFIDTPKIIEENLANGGFTLVGEQMLAGEETLKLMGKIGDTTEVLWVDATTYLPVQQTDVPSGAGTSTQASFSWSTLTPTSAKLFKLTIPSGFRHVSDR
jgi:hypothetical protein